MKKEEEKMKMKVKKDKEEEKMKKEKEKEEEKMKKEKEEERMKKEKEEERMKKEKEEERMKKEKEEEGMTDREGRTRDEKEILGNILSVAPFSLSEGITPKNLFSKELGSDDSMSKAIKSSQSQEFRITPRRSVSVILTEGDEFPNNTDQDSISDGIVIKNNKIDQIVFTNVSSTDIVTNNKNNVTSTKNHNNDNDNDKNDINNENNNNKGNISNIRSVNENINIILKTNLNSESAMETEITINMKSSARTTESSMTPHRGNSTYINIFNKW